MTLKVFTVFMFIGIFFAVLSNYYLTKYSPFEEAKIDQIIQEKQIEEDDWERLDAEIVNIVKEGHILEYLSRDAYLGWALICATFFCFFVALHTGIDKLFFKKFFESPSIFDSIRRGLEIITTATLLLYLYFYSLDIYTIITIGLLVLLLEVIFTKFAARKVEEEIMQFIKKVTKK